MKEQSKIGLLLLLLKSNSIIKLEEMRETFKLKLNFNQVENEAAAAAAAYVHHLQQLHYGSNFE